MEDPGYLYQEQSQGLDEEVVNGCVQPYGNQNRDIVSEQPVSPHPISYINVSAALKATMVKELAHHSLDPSSGECA